MRLMKPALAVALGVGLMSSALPAQAAKHTRTIPTTFRHTWFAYDHHGGYDQLKLTKHSINGKMRYEDGTHHTWVSAKGKHLGVWPKGNKKITLYNTTHGFQLASQPLTLTRTTRAGHARLKVTTDNSHLSYYRTKALAYHFR